jgi:hypothetical protein
MRFGAFEMVVSPYLCAIETGSAPASVAWPSDAVEPALEPPPPSSESLPQPARTAVARRVTSRMSKRRREVIRAA